MLILFCNFRAHTVLKSKNVMTSRQRHEAFLQRHRTYLDRFLLSFKQSTPSAKLTSLNDVSFAEINRSYGNDVTYNNVIDLNI